MCNSLQKETLKKENLLQLITRFTTYYSGRIIYKKIGRYKEKWQLLKIPLFYISA